MKITANTDYDEMPTAIVEFYGYTRDVYPVLGKTQQNKVNRTYEVVSELIISLHAMEQTFPEAYQAFEMIKRSPWIVNRAQAPVKMPEPEPEPPIVNACMNLGRPLNDYEVEAMAEEELEQGILLCEVEFEERTNFYLKLTEALEEGFKCQ